MMRKRYISASACALGIIGVTGCGSGDDATTTTGTTQTTVIAAAATPNTPVVAPPVVSAPVVSAPVAPAPPPPVEKPQHASTTQSSTSDTGTDSSSAASPTFSQIVADYAGRIRNAPDEQTCRSIQFDAEQQHTTLSQDVRNYFSQGESAKALNTNIAVQAMAQVAEAAELMARSFAAPESILRDTAERELNDAANTAKSVKE